MDEKNVAMICLTIIVCWICYQIGKDSLVIAGTAVGAIAGFITGRLSAAPNP